MKCDFGELLNKILKEKNVSAYKVSQATNLTKSHIYKILKGEVEPTLYVLYEISIALKLDFEEYYKIARDFNSLQEYENFTYLRELIESKVSVDLLEEKIEKFKIVNINEGKYKQLIYYVKAYILTVKYKNYKKSLEYCSMSLKVKSLLLFENKIEKYITSDVSYNIISLIQYNYTLLNEKARAKSIAFKLIDIIESIYFKNNISNINVPKLVLRTYIAMLNNLSDILLDEKVYNEVIIHCEKGLHILKKYNSIYGLINFCDLLFQSYYLLENLEQSKIYYNKAKSACVICDDVEYLIRIKERIVNKYVKLICL